MMETMNKTSSESDADNLGELAIRVELKSKEGVSHAEVFIDRDLMERIFAGFQDLSRERERFIVEEAKSAIVSAFRELDGR
jgi:hypothetical protein